MVEDPEPELPDDDPEEVPDDDSFDDEPPDEPSEPADELSLLPFTTLPERLSVR